MKCIRLIVLVATVVALFSVIVVAVAAAAEPNLLGEKGQPPVSFKGSSGLSTIETPETPFPRKIECEADNPLGEFESEGADLLATRGPFHVDFEKCSSKMLGSCTGTGASRGLILALGTFQLRWWGRSRTEHKVAFDALLREVSFTCGFTSFALRGCVAGNVEPVHSGLRSTFSILFRQERGKQEIAEVFNEAGTTKEACKMELREGAGAFEGAGLQTTEAIGGFVNREGETITVEIMG